MSLNRRRVRLGRLRRCFFGDFGGAFFFIFIFVVSLGEGVVFGLGGVVVVVVDVVVVLREGADFLRRVGVRRWREHLC